MSFFSWETQEVDNNRALMWWLLIFSNVNTSDKTLNTRSYRCDCCFYEPRSREAVCHILFYLIQNTRKMKLRPIPATETSSSRQILSSFSWTLTQFLLFAFPGQDEERWQWTTGPSHDGSHNNTGQIARETVSLFTPCRMFACSNMTPAFTESQLHPVTVDCNKKGKKKTTYFWLYFTCSKTQ